MGVHLPVIESVGADPSLVGRHLSTAGYGLIVFPFPSLSSHRAVCPSVCPSQAPVLSSTGPGACGCGGTRMGGGLLTAILLAPFRTV